MYLVGLSGSNEIPFPQILALVFLYQRSHSSLLTEETDLCLWCLLAYQSTCYPPGSVSITRLHIPKSLLGILALLTSSPTQAFSPQLLILLTTQLFLICSASLLPSAHTHTCSRFCFSYDQIQSSGHVQSASSLCSGLFRGL